MARSQQPCASQAQIAWEKGARESPGRNLIRSRTNADSVCLSVFLLFFYYSCMSLHHSISPLSMYLLLHLMFLDRQNGGLGLKSSSVQAGQLNSFEIFTRTCSPATSLELQLRIIFNVH